MSLDIRAAGEAEAEVVWRLTLDAFEAHRALLDPPSGVFRETAEEVLRAMREGRVYLALRAGEPVGTARVRAFRDEHALYCGRLAVAPGAQRSGVGTALMARVERQAAEEGFPAVVVGVRSVLPANLRFFAALGYVAYAERSHPGYGLPTYLLLRKGIAIGT